MNNDLNNIDIGHLNGLFQNSSKANSTNEMQQLRDRLYCTDSKYQLNAGMLAELRARKMPALTLNYCEKLKRNLIGLIESNPIEPQAIPLNPQSQNGCDIATKLVRQSLTSSEFDLIRLSLADDFWVEGTATVLVDIEEKFNYRTGETSYHPKIHRVSPYDFFYDPSSRDVNFCDSSYFGIRKWVTEKQIQLLYPERYAEIGTPLDNLEFSSMFDNVDGTGTFMVDRPNRKFALIELYDNSSGQWTKTVYAQNGVYEFVDDAYIDNDGNSYCPIIATSNIVDIQLNCRIGSIRRVRNAQDVINQATIKCAAANNTRQIQQTDQAPVANTDEARREASKVDGVLPYGYQFVATSDVVSGNMELIQSNISFLMDSMPNGADQATIQQNNASGRSKLVDQQLGLLNFAGQLKSFSNLEKKLYKVLWNEIVNYYDKEQIINVSGDPLAPEFLEINKVTGYQTVPLIGSDGNPVIDPLTGTVALTQKPIIENRLIDFSVDFYFKEVPNTGTLRGEVFGQFMQLIQSGVSVNSPEFNVLLDMSPLEDKQEIRDDIEKWFGPSTPFDQQTAQSNAQQQQQLQNLQLQAQIKNGELQLAKLEAEIEQIRSTTLKNLASVHQTQQDMQIEAQTESVQIQHDIAESNLKNIKAAAMTQELEHDQQDHGLKLASLNSLLNN